MGRYPHFEELLAKVYEAQGVSHTEATRLAGLASEAFDKAAPHSLDTFERDGRICHLLWHGTDRASIKVRLNVSNGHITRVLHRHIGAIGAIDRLCA
jgi:hypothetical protein